ncbi:MAG: phage/plasmid primase, P4 family [Planctomycetaceae bacterium]
MMTSNGNGHIAVDDVKSAARGRWREVLTAFGFNGEDLDGRHHPCPRCNGTDRFRAFNDVDETGGVHCNQCFTEGNGDGLAAIQWRNGWDFPTAIKSVAEHLGVQPPNGHNKEHAPTSPFESQMLIIDEADPEYCSQFFAEFCAAKPPITAEAIVAAGGIPVGWPRSKEHGKCCLAFPALERPEKITGYILRRTDGSEFPAFGNLSSRKTHMLRGSHDGWVIPGGFERVASATIVWRVEGVPDALALYPHLPADHAIITNICGAKSCPKNIGILAGKSVNVIGDADTPGQEGAEKFARKMDGIAATTKIVPLPFDIVPDHGKDVRDFFVEGHTFAELVTLADAAPHWVKTAKTKSKPAKVEIANDTGDAWTSICQEKGRTELANARRFIAAFGENVRFCHAWTKWLVWDSTRWHIDDDGAVTRMATTVADQVWHEAVDYRTEETIDFATKTSRASGVSAMLKLAASMRPIRVDDLDANPWLLNCLNGTLDLRTGELRPHRREDNLTKLCPTNYNPDASSYHFDRFLEGVFDGPTIDFIQRFFGYCLSGDVQEQILSVFYGIGSNGKSTLLNAIQETLGTDFTSAAPSSLLLEKKHETHPTELASLFGKRLVIAQESNAGARLAEATVKHLTGGDVISARRMKEDFWTFKPTHKFCFCTNHKPQVEGTDHAIWRRLVLVPFARKFWNPDKGETGPAELRQDKTLPVKLTAEAEGILAWMVRGCLDWQSGGLRIPESVRAATAEYRSESDTIGRFVETCCIRSNAVRVKFSSLYSSLEKWSNESGDNIPPKRLVGSWLKENGFKEHTNNGRWYLGITTTLEHTPTHPTERTERTSG